MMMNTLTATPRTRRAYDHRLREQVLWSIDNRQRKAATFATRFQDRSIRGRRLLPRFAGSCDAWGARLDASFRWRADIVLAGDCAAATPFSFHIGSRPAPDAARLGTCPSPGRCPGSPRTVAGRHDRCFDAHEAEAGQPPKAKRSPGSPGGQISPSAPRVATT